VWRPHTSYHQSWLKELSSEAQGWKIDTAQKQSTIAEAGIGRDALAAASAGTLICEKPICPFTEDNTDLIYPVDGCISFKSNADLETYVDYVVAKGVAGEKILDLLMNFAHGFRRIAPGSTRRHPF